MNPMTDKNAEIADANLELATDCLKNFNLGHWSAVLHDEVVLEFPHGLLVKMPRQVVGKAAAISFLDKIMGEQRGQKFYDIAVMPTAEFDTVIAEYAGCSLLPSSSGRKQVFIAFMSFRGGKLVLFREYLNRLQTFKAFGSTCADEY